MEHPGLALGMPSCERLNGLLRGMPHALVLFSEDGDTFLLLSALAKPCRLHDPAEALNKPTYCDTPAKFAANYVLGYFKVRVKK